MAKVYRDEEGHFTTKENDGGPCYHKVGRQGNKYQAITDKGEREDISNEEYSSLREMGLEDEEFDEELDSDFGEEESYKIYEDKIREELGKVKTKEDAEYVSGLIDDNLEAGYISEELADELYSELDKKIDENQELADHEGQDRYENVANILDNMVGPGGYENGVAKLKEMGINVPEEVGSLDMIEDGILIGYNDDGSQELWKYDVNNQKEIPVDEEASDMTVNEPSEPGEVGKAKKKYIDNILNGKNYDKRFKATVEELKKIPDQDIDEAIEKIISSGDDYFKQNDKVIEAANNLVEKYLADSPKPYPASGYHMAVAEMIRDGIKDNMTAAEQAEAMSQEANQIDDEEMQQINQEQEVRTQRQKRIAESIDKVRKMKSEGKTGDIMNYLRGLPQDEADEVIAELIK